MEWLKQLFCKHEYKAITNIIAIYENERDEYPVGHKQVYLCKKCLKKKIIRW